ncbi:unnamed protein product [Bursaphelenchus xylophilus]|uniref:Ribonuclease H1 n=1 Tax=Bursaphelenchus xylophilus TaxID=6326 RepID=A0A1I7SV41_BURXY|nr:unnamed protein product [Bursaphelenchus xylophilus]CAG9100866.1 unnamed protein product [Bursaphelenchus xylophilus]
MSSLYRFISNRFCRPYRNQFGYLVSSPNFKGFVMPFYAVAKGRRVGIYETWKECKAQTDGFQGPRFKKFNTKAEAQSFIDENKGTGGVRRNVGGQEPGPSRKRPNLEPGNGASSVVKKAKGLGPHPDAPTVWTDGACRGNGKKHARAGWGVYWDDGHRDNRCGPLEGPEQTNNRAEYTAVIEAIKTAKERGLRKLNLNTDSNLLVRSMTEWMPKWRKNGWKTGTGGAVKNKDLLLKINELCSQVDVRFQHVDGHAGIHGNEMADQLACRGADGG